MMDGTDHGATLCISRWPGAGYLWAGDCERSRTLGWLSTSRRFLKRTAIDVCVNLREQPVKFSGGCVGGNLSIPFVVSPAMQQTLQLRTFVKREPVDRGLNFLYGAHVKIISPCTRRDNCCEIRGSWYETLRLEIPHRLLCASKYFRRGLRNERTR